MTDQEAKEEELTDEEIKKTIYSDKKRVCGWAAKVYPRDRAIAKAQIAKLKRLGYIRLPEENKMSSLIYQRVIGTFPTVDRDVLDALSDELADQILSKLKGELNGINTT